MSATPPALRLVPVLFLALLGSAAGCSDPADGPGPGTDGDAAAADGGADAEPDGGAPDGDDAAGDGEVVLPSGECASDDDCQIEGPLPACKNARCIDAACTLAPEIDGFACDDGLKCTLDDQCTDGVCAGTAKSCDDANPCTTDGCDPNGGCVHTFNQKPCSDGDACTVEDRCQGGECGGDAFDCDDGNPCTANSCDPLVGCVSSHVDVPCDDLDACTEGDACVLGTCQPGAPKDCGIASQCVEASCDPDLGCLGGLVVGACDDEDACTEKDECQEGTCVGKPVPCVDDNPCTDEVCDAVKGCEHLPNVGPCEDGDECTLDDFCTGKVCQPGDVDLTCCDVPAECDDGDLCTVDDCAGGHCTNDPLPCGDGFLCTADSCEDGECVHTNLGPLPTGATFTADFEGDLKNWTVKSSNAQVGWQIDTSKSHTGAQSLYFGNIPAYTYDFGVTKATVERGISVPKVAASLRFYITQDLGADGGPTSKNYDITSLSVGDETLQPTLFSSIPDWELRTYDLTPWAGKNVLLRITFDTVDANSNEGQGVWIDDLEVVSEAPGDCCGVPDDCAPHELGDCAVASCTSGTCAHDTSGCE